MIEGSGRSHQGTYQNVSGTLESERVEVWLKVKSIGRRGWVCVGEDMSSDGLP